MYSAMALPLVLTSFRPSFAAVKLSSLLSLVTSVGSPGIGPLKTNPT